MLSFFTKRRQREELQRRNPQLMSGQDSYTFRRSRTLTGTTSQNVKSASEPQGQLKSPRLKAHELRRHRRYVTGALCSCLLASALVYWLLTQLVVNISSITYVVPTKTSPRDSEYVEVMQRYYRERPLERFRFALNAQNMLDYLQQKHPELESLDSIAFTGIGTSSIALKLRQPIVGWKVGGEYYYVDKNGESFRENYYAPPQVTVRDLSGISPDATNGGAIASNRFLSFLGRVVSLTSTMHVGRVTTVTIPRGVGTRTVELSLKGRGMPIRLHIDRDPAAQVEDMRRSLAFFDGRGIQPKYIDIRVAGKAFYRE